MKNREPKTISFEELMKELEACRVKPTKITLTQDQKKFLKRARENQRPAAWLTIKRLWDKKWPPLSITSLRGRYEMIKQEKL
ncbi:MAG: hypothetical protein M0R03_19820 [Novosphingobium sp.]|nr:hypothetical protein [Novosphingobium sp.]